jgi:DNA ligase (NAD+)
MIERLGQRGVHLADEAPAKELADKPLEGLTFVITGTLPSLSRDEAASLIESHGGRVTSSVSGSTDYLLVGDKPGTSKDQRGRKARGAHPG